MRRARRLSTLQWFFMKHLMCFGLPQKELRMKKQSLNNVQSRLQTQRTNGTRSIARSDTLSALSSKKPGGSSDDIRDLFSMVVQDGDRHIHLLDGQRSDEMTTSSPVPLREIMDEAFARALAATTHDDLPEGYDPKDFEDSLPDGYDPKDFEDDLPPGYNPRDFEDGPDYSVDALAADVDYALALSLQEAEADSDYTSLVSLQASVANDADDNYDEYEEDDDDVVPANFDFSVAPKDDSKPKRKKRVQKDARRFYSAAKVAAVPRQLLALKGRLDDMDALMTFLSTQKNSLAIANDGHKMFRAAAHVGDDEFSLYVKGTEADMQVLLAYVMTQVESVVILAVKDVAAAPEPLISLD
ncbi:hypothetical protein SDRG_12626 [Saprolegnia diclina VS20]|uniref:Uncharacterized protein n=1 Tax=Saprolegnia diclina (strain VS20) TaxID=1156394 RepID=T0Q4T7_SAPDV|nr:hypothetical protein SDRG_12626 [Saprolegnia diclina VS20]EQC29621.1 hypothetical protein SDRG_12626 [Saprolegnia diclina VS20]|eukprot:XP_008616925.1 hypothetical protein SDRG_12626 [Saprolegnia diclina VS20]